MSPYGDRFEPLQSSRTPVGRSFNDRSMAPVAT